MAESFGARLRQQRERRQIALAFIADQTKISVARLEALERDDVSNWPAGIFRRSFIRAYARTIGLDPDAVVREFLELYPDPVEVSDATPPDVDGAFGSLLPPTRLGYVVASAIRSLSGFRLQGVQKHDPTTPDPTADRVAVGGLPTFAVEPEASAMDFANELRVITSASDPEPDVSPLEFQFDAIASIDAPDPEADVQTFELPVDANSTVDAPDPEPDVSAVARLCTELARVSDIHEVPPLLATAAQIFDAAGMIVWIWDPRACRLTPALAHGYSDEVLARLPAVRRDADNVTAASFRSAQTRIVSGGDLTSGAVVVPLVRAAGCVGVFTVELQNGGEHRESVCALATILAAQLATFLDVVPLAEAVNA